MVENKMAPLYHPAHLTAGVPDTYQEFRFKKKNNKLKQTLQKNPKHYIVKMRPQKQLNIVTREGVENVQLAGEKNWERHESWDVSPP